MKVNDKGLIPAIAQDVNTGKVLMMGYMNSGTLKRTLEGSGLGLSKLWPYRIILGHEHPPTACHQRRATPQDEHEVVPLYH